MPYRLNPKKVSPEPAGEHSLPKGAHKKTKREKTLPQTKRAPCKKRTYKIIDAIAVRNIYFVEMQNDGAPQNPDSGEPQSYGRYKVIELLGEGAMGRVYLSEDPILKRKVAVKVISTDRGLDPAVLGEYLERFTVEAQACARLNHPSIVSIYDAGEHHGVPWIAFEYVSGEHLDRLIARQKQLPFDRILKISADIAAAMAHAHSLKIVHRDIKPANILIDDQSQVAKLADFGVVKSPFTAITQTGTAVGSPGYMSPEQIDNLDIDPRSDIFSFGIVLYEMITGAHPFLKDSLQATFFATVSCSYTPIAELREDVPEKLAKIVEKALVADKKLRIIDAAELCSMIAHCMDGAPRRTAMTSVMETRRGAAKWAKFIYAQAERKIRGILKKLPPLYRRTSSDISGFGKERFIPSVKKTAGKIYAPLEKRFSKTQMTIAVTAVTSLAAAIILIMLFSAMSSKTGNKKALVSAAQQKGYVIKDGKQLIDTCRAYINTCNYWSANELADILAASKNKNFALHGHLFKAMAALCSDKLSEAAELFSEVQSLDGGENAIRREHPFFIKYLEDWIERELTETLVSLCAERLFLHENPQVKAWTREKQYWTRWNAVLILQKGGEKVDLVPVYIMDLDHSASARTKIRAAERLGDIGDKRAVTALIAARDGKGPAASVARRVLREKFNVW